MSGEVREGSIVLCHDMYCMKRATREFVDSDYDYRSRFYCDTHEPDRPYIHNLVCDLCYSQADHLIHGACGTHMCHLCWEKHHGEKRMVSGDER